MAAVAFDFKIRPGMLRDEARCREIWLAATAAGYRPADEDGPVRGSSGKFVAELPVSRAHGEVIAYIHFGIPVGSGLILDEVVVSPYYRRRYVGRALMAYLAEMLDRGGRQATAVLRESNLSGQLFLRDCGWRAVDVLRGRFADGTEDGYRFARVPKAHHP